MQTSLIAGICCALAPAWSMAAIVASGAGVAPASGSGVTWTYAMQLTRGQNASPGLPFNSGTVVQGGSGQGSFFTLYDFAGYVAGSCRAPAGWVCSAQSLGFTPGSLHPGDDPEVLNLTWVYVSGPLLRSSSNALELGSFSARSSFMGAAMLDYAARSTKTRGSGSATVADYAGRVAGPSAGAMQDVPEPGTLSLAGIALGWLALRALPRSKAALPFV